MTAKKIEAIELNPIVINLMEERYDDYSGQLFNRPEVTILQAERRENMITWAWATNNFCSILASVSAVMIALSFGFQAVGYLAAAIYLGGLFAMMWGRKVSNN
jgi:hypothetical protein